MAESETQRTTQTTGDETPQERGVPVRIAEITPKDPLGTGAEMRPVTGERLQMLHQRVPSGAVVPSHHHDNEQMNFVISGRLRVVVEGVEIEFGPDEVIVVKANAEHSIEALQDAVFIEVTAPPRPEFAA